MKGKRVSKEPGWAMMQNVLFKSTLKLAKDVNLNILLKKLGLWRIFIDVTVLYSFT